MNNRHRGIVALLGISAALTSPRARTINGTEPGIPDGATAFPEDFWISVKQGEILSAFFKLKDGGEAICLANHNAYAWQGGLIVPQQDSEKKTE